MKTKAIHKRKKNGVACNIQNRWESCDLSSIGDDDRVTCKRCQRLKGRGR